MLVIKELEKQGNWLFRYRSYIPLVLIPVAMGVLAYRCSRIGLEAVVESYLSGHAPAFAHWHTYTFGALLVGLVGLAIRAYTVGHTPANTSGRNTADGQVAAEVNTTGAYSMVRHPLYLGNYLMWLAVAMMSLSWGFVIIFSLLFWLFYERIMVVEEQFLSQKFGTEYTAWAEETPAFIPKPSLFRVAKYSFSWRKVLKKEKNGLLALLLLLTLFDLEVSWLVRDVSPNIFLITLTVLALVAFIALKVMKAKHMLDEEGR